MNLPLPNGIECKFTTLNSDRTYLVLNHAIQNYTPMFREKRKEERELKKTVCNILESKVP